METLIITQLTKCTSVGFIIFTTWIANENYSDENLWQALFLSLILNRSSASSI